MKGIINDLRRRLSNSQWGGAEIGNHAWLYIETQVGVDIWERVCSDACLSTEIRIQGRIEEDLVELSWKALS